MAWTIRAATGRATARAARKLATRTNRVVATDRGTPLIRAGAAARPNSWQPAAPACFIASRLIEAVDPVKNHGNAETAEQDFLENSLRALRAPRLNVGI